MIMYFTPFIGALIINSNLLQMNVIAYGRWDRGANEIELMGNEIKVTTDLEP